MLQHTPLLLNPDFKYALDVLEKTDNSLFITGKAGTGKSTLLQLFKNTTRKKAAVLAPTGVAALNVQGQTVHSFFGFPPRIITPQEASRKVMRKDLLRLYKNLQVLIIDEISMVRADILDGMDKFLRVNRENFRPFGGVQVVFFGDLFQLPPVVTRDPVEAAYFQDYYETPYFFSGKVFQEPDFAIDMLELRKVYRQESRHFLRLLEAVRVNEIDRDDLEDLNERCLPGFSPGEGYITLCSRNATANRINQRELSVLSTKEFVFQADIKGSFDPSLFPTEASLSLREGAQVMFVKNDTEERQFV
ncbi:MAG: AAA family ATPase, partial [Saprospiraceae bacterium]|nr:AAA family ATPase [Saprospiraceae bacterium]